MCWGWPSSAGPLPRVGYRSAGRPPRGRLQWRSAARRRSAAGAWRRSPSTADPSAERDGPLPVPGTGTLRAMSTRILVTIALLAGLLTGLVGFVLIVALAPVQSHAAATPALPTLVPSPSPSPSP